MTQGHTRHHILRRCRGKVLFPLALALFFAGNSPAQELPVEAGDLLQSAEEWARDNLDEGVLQSLQQVDQDQVLNRLNEFHRRLQGQSVYDLGPLKESATLLLPLLRHYEETDPFAQWLQTRLDYFEVADELQKQSKPAPTPLKPGQPPPVLPPAPVPSAPPTPQLQRQLWSRQLEKRPVPTQAETYLSQLKPIFVAANVPPQLVWLAEIESAFNPKARSPSGAVGMFQMMKPTAQRFGLSTSLPDERLHPQKNARAAASYLRYLHDRYKDWPLTLAAYNAGEGRVDAVLKKTGLRTFEEIARHLPAETQLYVPKCEATLRKREGLPLSGLKRPKN